MAKEILDIVDDNGQPTGEVIDRVTAHREGILHRTSHVWLVRMKDSRLQVLLQKRSEEKDSYPVAMTFPVQDIFRQGWTLCRQHCGN